jgi:single-strand DNA-binding protein
MSRSLNKVFLIGNVGAEPEARTTAGGKRVVKFSLATSRSFNDNSGQKQERTEWHRLTAWDRTAEIIEQYVHKGDRVYVEGSIEYSQTEDESGKPRYWTNIVVREFLMLGNGSGAPRERQPAAAPGPSPNPFQSPFDDDDDDLPF